MECRICGCTDHDACFDPQTGLTCAWIEPGLCSFCPNPDAETPLVELVSDAEATAYLQSRR